MSCDPQIFHGIDAAVLDRLHDKLKGVGYNLEGNKGTINGPMGIVIDYEWNEGAATLMIHVTSKNVFIPCSKIYSELDKAVEACKAG